MISHFSQSTRLNPRHIYCRSSLYKKSSIYGSTIHRKYFNYTNINERSLINQRTIKLEGAIYVIQFPTDAGIQIKTIQKEGYSISAWKHPVKGSN